MSPKLFEIGFRTSLLGCAFLLVWISNTPISAAQTERPPTRGERLAEKFRQQIENQRRNSQPFDSATETKSSPQHEPEVKGTGDLPKQGRRAPTVRQASAVAQESVGVVQAADPMGEPKDVVESQIGESHVGDSQVGSGYNNLESLERLAIENHPSLNAAVANILAARHEALQAGLHPNPSIQFFMDEMGNDNDPGLWGAHFQQSIVRGNKLALGQTVKNREATVLELEFEKQVLRIKTDVRTAFYRLLIAQQRYRLLEKLYQSQHSSIEKSKGLFEAGETPKTDLLQTELQAQSTLILMRQSEFDQKNGWRELAAVIGQPEMAFRQLNGSLDPIARELSFEYCLDQILTNSPELHSAKAEVDRARSALDLQLANAVPNYQSQVSVGRDSTSNHFFTGVQLQIPLQICNKNQGNIAAAKSRLVVAQNNVETIKLSLSKRLSTEIQQYQSAFVKSSLFTKSLLPKAQQTLDILTQGYPLEVSFLQLMTAQQTVIEITLEYLDSLNQLWSSRLKIEGLLLDDSLGQ